MSRTFALTSVLGWTLLLSLAGWPAATLAQDPATPEAAAAPEAAPPAAETPATPDAAALVVAPALAATAAGSAPYLAGTYDTGSIAWLMTSAALVFFMMPGLALFYGGMVRAKNVLNMFMCVMVCIPIVAIQWVCFGYSLAFAVPSAIAVDAGKNDDGSDKPDLSYLGWDPELVGFQAFGELAPDNVNFYGRIVTSGDTTGAAPTGVPELLFAMFQMMFAIITPALIVGALAERVKFSAWCVFVALWATIVYDPVCHWVWNVNGWMFQAGMYDFAGGTVVHVLAGVSALALILILPKRRGYPTGPFLPHSIGWTLMGAGLLMVGWFGFNAGSAIAVGKDFLPVSAAVAVLAFATTAIAGSAAAGSWMVAEWLYVGKPTALGLGSGIVAGLVAITPCSGHVSPSGALIIGLLGGVVCFLGVQMKQVFKYDDSLDVVGVHGVGGALGAILVGYFAIRPVAGNFDQVILQIKGVAVTGIYAFVCTLVLGLIIHYTIGFTVDEKTEEEGLDVKDHGEVAYRFN
ncbi:MAG TPA: ammonium transporter [Planctomycetaceae bacterium]|nr:ammonium transporter [Planctomycetaceae bacterium]